jgi:hypothetical protein
MMSTKRSHVNMGSVRRADIIVVNKKLKQGCMFDPTIWLEKQRATKRGAQGK